MFAAVGGFRSADTDTQQVLFASSQPDFVSVTGLASDGTFVGGYANPGTSGITTPTGVNRAVFSSSKMAVGAVGNGISTPPNMRIWRWSDSGAGSQYSGATGVPSNPRAIRWIPANNRMLISTSGGTGFYNFPWNDTTGYGTPASGGGPNNAIDMIFGPSGAVLFACKTVYPAIAAYPRAGDFFGTKYADPGTLPPSSVPGIVVSPTNNYVFAACRQPGISPGGLYVWAWNDLSGWGTLQTDPGTGAYPTVYGGGVDINADNNAVVIAAGAGTQIVVVPWNGSSFGTPVTYTGLAPSNANCVKFNKEGDYIILGGVNYPSINVYPWNNGQLGSRTVINNSNPINSIEIR